MFPDKWLLNTWKWSAWCETCCEAEFAFKFLHLVPTIVSITVPAKMAYVVKTVPLILALKTNHVLLQMPNRCTEPACVCTSHTYGHRALVPPSRSLSILRGNKHTNGLLKVILWESGSALSSCTKKKITITPLGYGPRPLHLVYWSVSWSPFYIMDSGVKSVWGKTQISQESPTQEKREISSFYLVSVPFPQKQMTLSYRGRLFSSLNSWQNVHLHKWKVFSILWPSSNISTIIHFINISKPQFAESMRSRKIACVITFMTW